MAAFLKGVSLWPYGIIPYAPNSTHPFWSTIVAAIQEMNSKTTLRFVERTTESLYVKFTFNAGDGNSSSAIGVPFQPPGQPPTLVEVNIDKNVRALHELGHVIGLIHEHQRTDRDAYLRLEDSNFAKDQSGNYTNFVQGNIVAKEAMESETTYDIGSIEHYWYTAGAKTDGLRTMTYLKEPNLQFYTAEALSRQDIAGIDSKYTANIARTPYDQTGGVSDPNYEGPLRDQYLDTNPVMCPPGLVVAGFALWKRGNRLAPQLLCTKPDGTEGRWVFKPLEASGGVSDPNYTGPLHDQYLDTNPVECPPGLVVAGFAFWKRGNRVAPQLLCTKPDGKEGRWVFKPLEASGGVSDPNYEGPLHDQYLDTNPVTCPPGLVAGFALWKRGNRIASMIYYV